jgi:RNA polymerase sigma factor (sigma-70 family)
MIRLRAYANQWQYCPTHALVSSASHQFGRGRHGLPDRAGSVTEPAPERASREADAAQDLAWWRAAREEGAADAFGSLYVRHYQALVRFVARSGAFGTADAAQDLVHDVFVQLWISRERVAIVGTVRSYLYRAVLHRACDARDRERVAARHGAVFANTGEVPGAGTLVDDPEATLAHKELTRVLTIALRQLSERQRQIAWMRWIDQLSRREIAEILDVSEATVNNHLTKAMQALRVQLGGQQHLRAI